MSPADLAILLQKVGAAAMMNNPPIPVPNLENIMETLSDSGLVEYMESLDNPTIINTFALLRGLNELGERYFQKHDVPGMAVELMDIFHGFSRQRPVPVPLFIKNREKNVERKTDSMVVTTDSRSRGTIGAGASVAGNSALDGQRQDVTAVNVSPTEPVEVSSTSLVEPPIETEEEWLRRRNEAYDSSDELQRHAQSVIEAAELDLIAENVNQIDLSERVQNIQSLEIEDRFPMPDNFITGDGFGEEPQIQRISVCADVHVPVLPESPRQPIPLDQTPVNEEMPPPTVEPQRQRRVRRIAEIDPNYRPPKVRRPPRLNDGDQPMLTVYDVQEIRNLIRDETAVEQPIEENLVVQRPLLEGIVIEPCLAEPPGRKETPQVEPEVVEPMEAVRIEPDLVMPLPIEPMEISSCPFLGDSFEPMPLNISQLRTYVPPATPLHMNIPRPTMHSKTFDQSNISTPIASAMYQIHLTPDISPIRTSDMQPQLDIPSVSGLGPAEPQPDAASTHVDPSAQRLPTAVRASHIPQLSPIVETIDVLDPLLADISQPEQHNRSTANADATQKAPRTIQPITEIPPNMLWAPNFSVSDTQTPMGAMVSDVGKLLLDPEASLRADNLLRGDAASAFVALCHLHNKQFLRMDSVATNSGCDFMSVLLPDTDSDSD